MYWVQRTFWVCNWLFPVAFLDHPSGIGLGAINIIILTCSSFFWGGGSCVE